MRVDKIVAMGAIFTVIPDKRRSRADPGPRGRCTALLGPGSPLRCGRDDGLGLASYGTSPAKNAMWFFIG